jgi:hypothetical protein
VEYVMVPVPEELADRVLTYVSWKETQAKPGPPADQAADDGGAMAQAFERLDAAGRALVGVIAAAALEAEELTIPEAAARAGVTAREAVGLLLEVNSVVAREGGPPLAFGGKDLGGSGDDFTWDTHMVSISKDVAGPLLELARSHGPQ